MAEAYIGEIRAFGFNFVPQGWLACDGRQLPIAQYTALYAVIGASYGPATTTTFSLPDFRGRAPIHWGAQPGQPPVQLGAASGSESVTLNSAQIAPHTHQVTGGANATASVVTQAPGPKSMLFRPYQVSAATGFLAWTTSNNPDGMLDASTVQPAGAGQPHENRQPYVTLNFCICVEGIFPPHS